MLKNKTVYYAKEKIKQSKMYGSITYKISVFIIKSGKLRLVGVGEQHTASTPGDRGECWLVLQSAGLVPKNLNPCMDCFAYCQQNNIKVRNIADVGYYVND